MGLFHETEPNAEDEHRVFVDGLPRTFECEGSVPRGDWTGGGRDNGDGTRLVLPDDFGVPTRCHSRMSVPSGFIWMAVVRSFFHVVRVVSI